MNLSKESGAARTARTVYHGTGPTVVVLWEGRKGPDGALFEVLSRPKWPLKPTETPYQHLPFARCFLDASGNLFKRLFIDTSNGVLVVASSSFYDSSLGWFGAGRTNKNSSHPWFRLTSSQHLGLLVCQTHGASSCEPR